ncbi:MAG: FG-GAP-like repeat-containing protein, partial [Mycobacterium sp.]
MIAASSRVIAALAAMCLGITPAQQVLTTFPAADIYHHMTPMGDLNGDGYEDLLVPSVFFTGFMGAALNYELRYYSGHDGSVIRTGPRFLYPDHIVIKATGDHDHDGVRDYICFYWEQTYNTQNLSVRSGRTDAIIWTRQKPFVEEWLYDAVGDIDINGDSELDLLVGHPSGPSTVGQLWAYDHLGNELYTRVGNGTTYSMSQSLAKLGDVNGDGCEDYVVGLGDSSYYGLVAVVSGINGQFLRVVSGLQIGDNIGAGCIGTGDLDGDGLPDFVAGGGLTAQYDTLHAFSGATGTRLFTYYTGTVGGRLGVDIRAGDYDQDGIDDIFCPWYGGLSVISGRSGTPLLNWTPGHPFYNGVFETQPLGTPEGFPHFFSLTHASGTFLLSAVPTTGRTLGPGCALSLPMVPRIGVSEPDAQTRRLTLADATPGSVAFLLLGLAQQSHAPLHLHPFGLPGCTLYPNLQVLGGFATGTTGNTAGYAFH